MQAVFLGWLPIHSINIFSFSSSSSDTEFPLRVWPRGLANFVGKVPNSKSFRFFRLSQVFNPAVASGKQPQTACK